MIKKINKIRNLGSVFRDYTRSTNLPEFKKYNLIYGWNACGKTTLSRLFDAISGSAIPNIEYEVEDDAGNKYKEDESFTAKIRVFNQDYIQRNLKISEGKSNVISISLGEENKELIEEIQSNRILLYGSTDLPKVTGKIAMWEGYKKKLIRKNTDRDNKFTQIAKTIGAAIGGRALRDYRKPQAEKEFNQLNKKSKLNVFDLELHIQNVKQESLEKIGTICFSDIEISKDNFIQPLALLDDLIMNSKEALCATVESEVIERLLNNKELSEWVEKGIQLHQANKSESCEFCLQPLPESRITQLAKHFNEAYDLLKSQIEEIENNLYKVQDAVRTIILPDRARFYSELQEEYNGIVSRFNANRNILVDEIASLILELNVKKSCMTKELKLTTTITYSDLNNTLNEANTQVNVHNKKTDDFDSIKLLSNKLLTDHYLSTIFDEVKSIDIEIKELSSDIETLDSEIKQITKLISEDMAKVSSLHKACDQINEKLKTFLGRQEILFVPNVQKETDENGIEKESVIGYQIMRGGVPATSLSEGEKTAIAFVYFVVHLGDQDFDKTNGLIIIDDPISSLDSSSLYQAFSFLKNAVKDSHQVFIFTHSFEFLKLLMNWLKGGRYPTGYFMIKNHFIGNDRLAFIDEMDKELWKYESEYHYLFKLLKTLRDAQNETIERAYPIPNIARKVWDTFLMFSVPDGRSNYDKMDHLKKEGSDSQKLDAIYKFTNDQSHVTGSGFDPALVPETKKVVNELFEVMEQISPNHFKIIDIATN